jgi:hypothetical protein
LFPSSREPASPQKGLWATSETLTAEYDGHHVEVIGRNRWFPSIGLELWLNRALVDASDFGVTTSQAEPVLQGELPGGIPVLVRVQGGKLWLPRYTLEVDGGPVPMEVERGRTH